MVLLCGSHFCGFQKGNNKGHETRNDNKSCTIESSTTNIFQELHKLYQQNMSPEYNKNINASQLINPWLEEYMKQYRQIFGDNDQSKTTIKHAKIIEHNVDTAIPEMGRKGKAEEIITQVGEIKENKDNFDVHQEIRKNEEKNDEAQTLKINAKHLSSKQDEIIMIENDNKMGRGPNIRQTRMELPLNTANNKNELKSEDIEMMEKFNIKIEPLTNDFADEDVIEENNSETEDCLNELKSIKGENKVDDLVKKIGTSNKVVNEQNTENMYEYIDNAVRPTKRSMESIDKNKQIEKLSDDTERTYSIQSGSVSSKTNIPIDMYGLKGVTELNDTYRTRPNDAVRIQKDFLLPLKYKTHQSKYDGLSKSMSKDYRMFQVETNQTRSRDEKPGKTNDGPGYKCNKCGNAYARLHSLSRHIKFECGVAPQFECFICHKKSKHKHNLLLHMKTHAHK